MPSLTKTTQSRTTPCYGKRSLPKKRHTAKTPPGMPINKTSSTLRQTQRPTSSPAGPELRGNLPRQ
eukprot:9907432-Lingulodinium_polyedra.AAC.1